MIGPYRDEDFARLPKVPLTKAPIRALVASLLQPLHGRTVGEVGTGTGGITSELARAVGPGRVYSMDPSKEAIEVATKNLTDLGLIQKVTLIPQGAPEGLSTVPTLDGLVIGGHGGNLRSIIAASLPKMSAGSRIVVTANMPSTAVEALDTMEACSMAPEMWQIAPSMGHKTGGGWMLKALNPVFIVWGDVPQDRSEIKESLL